MKRSGPIAFSITSLILALSVVSLAGCAPSSAPTPSSSPTSDSAPTSAMTSGTGVTIDLVAKNISFNLKEIKVPAGAQVTINFDNQDSGIPHNFAVYTDASASNPIFVGQTISGLAKTTYRLVAPAKPGTYFFRCDVHPTIMTGAFVAE